MKSARRVVLGVMLGTIVVVGGAGAADENSIKDERSTGSGSAPEFEARCDIRSLEADKTAKSLVVTVGLRGAQKEFINTYLNINTKGNAKSIPEFRVSPDGGISEIVGTFESGQLQEGEIKGQGTAKVSGKDVIFKLPLSVVGAAKTIGAQAQTCGEGSTDIAPGKDYFGDKSYDGTVAYQYLNVDGAERVIEGRVVLSCSGTKSCQEIPVEGVKVKASGPKVYRATTGTDGAFAFAVKKGVYKVTADAGELHIEGKDKRVDVTKKRSGRATFEACGRAAISSAAAVPGGDYVGGGEYCLNAFKVQWNPGNNTLFIWWNAITTCKELSTGKRYVPGQVTGGKVPFKKLLVGKHVNPEIRGHIVKVEEAAVTFYYPYENLPSPSNFVKGSLRRDGTGTLTASAFDSSSSACGAGITDLALERKR